MVRVCVCLLLLLISVLSNQSLVLYTSISLTSSSTCGTPHRLMGLCSPMNCGWVWLSAAWLVFTFSPFVFPPPHFSTSFSAGLSGERPLHLDIIYRLYYLLLLIVERSRGGEKMQKSKTEFEWTLMSISWALMFQESQPGSFKGIRRGDSSSPWKDLFIYECERQEVVRSARWTLPHSLVLMKRSRKSLLCFDGWVTDRSLKLNPDLLQWRGSAGSLSWAETPKIWSHWKKKNSAWTQRNTVLK